MEEILVKIFDIGVQRICMIRIIKLQTVKIGSQSPNNIFFCFVQLYLLIKIASMHDKKAQV